MVTSDDRIERIRIAVNGAAARPLRLKAVEDAVRGRPAQRGDWRDGGKAGCAGAVPLQFKRLQNPLMRNLVKRAISGVQEQHGHPRVGDESVGAERSDPYCMVFNLGFDHRGIVVL